MSTETDSVADSIVTVADGRAALGVTANVFAKAYARTGDLPNGTGVAGSRSVLDRIIGTPDVGSEAVGLLDQANGYATRIYGELSAQPDADLIGDLNRQKVVTCFSQAEKALQLIDQQAKSSLWADWIEAMKAVVVGVAQGVAYVAKTITQSVFNLPPLVVAAGGVVLVALVYFGVRRIA